MDRNLDGIYIRIKRGDKYDAVCLSDCTETELNDFLDKYKTSPNAVEWLKGAVVHLAVTLKLVGDTFGIARGENDE